MTSSTKHAPSSQPSEKSAEKASVPPPGETATKQLPLAEAAMTRPSSALPTNVTDLLVTLGDWLNNLGIHIGEIPQMKVDLTENVSTYTLYADIPGVDKSDIKVQLESNCAVISVEGKKKVEQKEGERIISCERSRESVSRTIKLDEEIDVSKAQAKYENGVLELTMPKKHVRAIKELEIM